MQNETTYLSEATRLLHDVNNMNAEELFISPCEEGFEEAKMTQE